MNHRIDTCEPFASPEERLRHDRLAELRHARLAVLRACPIDFVNGLLPPGAPDPSAIAFCYGDQLITLATPPRPRGWVLTAKGQRQVAEGR